jgi:hypothetical protein
MTAERWRELIERQRVGGLSVEAFCRQHGVTVSTYYAWRQRLGAPGAAGAPRFVELTSADEAAADSETVPIEVWLSSGAFPGVMVRVPIGFDPATLRRVVEVLQ